MLTNTQISSYLVPKNIWNEGLPENIQIPSLSIPARDALEIERRRNNNINLRNEDHRYTIACERIQSVTAETFLKANNLPLPIIWPAHSDKDMNQASALAYLIVMETLYRTLWKSMDKLPYQRFLSVFFPPNDDKNHHSQDHFKLFQVLVNLPGIDNVMQRASNLSKRMGIGYEVTSEQCKQALIQRFDLVKTVQSQDCGLVDVVQIV